jgi:hypothetical protein
MKKENWKCINAVFIWLLTGFFLLYISFVILFTADKISIIVLLDIVHCPALATQNNVMELDLFPFWGENSSTRVCPFERDKMIGGFC